MFSKFSRESESLVRQKQLSLYPSYGNSLRIALVLFCFYNSRKKNSE